MREQSAVGSLESIRQRLKSMNLKRYNYTIHKNRRVNHIISSQIEQICELTINQVTDVASLVLLGGFARGEGSVKKKGGKIFPLGDYDILLVTRFPHIRLKITGLDDLAKRSGLSHIDCANVWKPRLYFVSKYQFWYDAKFGSKVIFGDKSVLNLIPIRDARDIDRKEGIRTLLNRLAGMIERCFNPEFLETGIPKGKRESVIFESVKAILACGESLLILNQQYDSSYYKRCQILKSTFYNDFRELALVDPSLIKDVCMATNFKLDVSFNKYSDAMKLWFDARKHVLNTLVYYWERYKGTRINNIEDFPSIFLRESTPEILYYIKHNYNAIKNGKSLRGLFQLKKSFYDIFGVALLYLMFSISETGQIDERIVDKALCLTNKMISASSKRTYKDKLQKWRVTRDLLIMAWYHLSL